MDIESIEMSYLHVSDVVKAKGMDILLKVILHRLHPQISVCKSPVNMEALSRKRQLYCMVKELESIEIVFYSNVCMVAPTSSITVRADL